ncbi:c2 domain containing protein [Stylonychia lemnae]|uniref:C2 domain containing protein n=1 Tax=Stylonychia lemnae TaxID=5949 RepID=A0A078B210_STYLE|nr:c2 domain containing protein [Stylonychia lemnae]|eukprot:CDW87383.1 c2 domain containing protein [Stylonychia lemnae]
MHLKILIGRRSRQLKEGNFEAENPNERMLKETTSQAHHAEFMIAKEREYEKVKQELYTEFKKLDYNNDDTITLNEIVKYLQEKVGDFQIQINVEQGGQDIDTGIAEEIFREIDKDNSGTISLVEFVESYFDQQREIEERVEELNKMIIEDEKKKNEIIEKLKEIQMSEQMNQYGIMVGSVLTATVIEARELRTSGQPNPYAILTVEGQKSQTDQVNGNSEPVWNEIISFDITTGKEPLIVQVYSRSNIGRDQLIGQCEVYMDGLIDQYKHDEWFQLENQGNYFGKIRMTLHWIHSRRKFLQDILKIQDNAIDEETQERNALEAQLQNMKSPFGFLQAYYNKEQIMDNGTGGLKFQNIQQFQAQAQVVEKRAEQKFDEYSNIIASKIGMKEIPWYSWTLYLTLIYTILTLLLTVCTVAIYTLLNLNKQAKNTFRMLVGGILISIIYDLVWFSLKTTEYEIDSKNDPGVEKSIKHFSLYASYISFFVRLIMGMIYWKDSLDFDNIMLGQKIAMLEQSPSPKERRQDNMFIRDVSPQGKGNGNFRF